MKRITKHQFPRWNFDQSKSFLLNGLYLAFLFLLLLMQACDKTNCEDDPCAEGCGECPDICETDPCSDPVLCPEQCPEFDDGTLGKSNLKATGNVEETADGMIVDGSLIITTPEDSEIVLDDAEIVVEYNDDRTVKSISGTSNAPSPTDYMEFTEPVQADVGYYSGKYLNDNWDLDILLVDERFYLAFKIAVALELKVGANSDPDATKPLSIKPPVGGHILYIYDYTDPFYFYSAAQDALGSLAFGESFQGYIPYVPMQPVDEIVSFQGNSVRGGKFPIYKVIEVNGTMIQATSFNVELVEENPFPTNFSSGYSAGVNGEFELSLPISDWISFSIPLGEASAAITAKAGTSGVEAQAFLNGLAKPDNSWWPEFIPVKPEGQIRASGYVQQEGKFDLELSGEYNLHMPNDVFAIEGSIGATNKALTIGGSMLANGLTWQAEAEFRANETEFKANPPQELLDDINNLVNSNIDSALTKAETALADLEKATEDYEFELSLRGLRSTIPTIVSEAKKRIADEVADGIESGRAQTDKILDDEGFALCSDNISKQVKKLDDPYIDALNRLSDAAANSNDNETTRKEIEGALRDLAKLDRLNKLTTVTIVAGNKKVNNPYPIPDVKKCTFTSSFKRTVKLDVQILTAQQVELLNTAADNVKFITETSDIKIEAEEIWKKVPSTEIMAKLKDDIENGTKSIPSIGEVGFINHHDKGTFSYYWVVNGERKELEDVDIFSPDAISDMIIDSLL